MLRASVLALLVERAAGHGWVTSPLSKNEFSHQVRDWNVFPSDMPGDFRNCPSCANHGNRGPPYGSGAGSCGAQEAEMSRGRDVWQKWYDQTGMAVPELVPGSDMEVRTSLPADHGGQAWFMIACGTEISEEVDWTILERSMDDRTHHFMPSSPSIYAWRQGEFGEPGSVAKYHVPSSFSCPDDRAVGRWVWKCSNVCNDANNMGRSTTTFVREEYAAVVGESILTTCTNGVEHFISCVDFKVVGSSSPPAPAPPGPSPTYAPTSAPPSPPPTTAPPSPPPAGPGLCCYGGCGNGNCQGGWCGESRGNCEGNCNGEFCPAASFASTRLKGEIAKHDA